MTKAIRQADTGETNVRLFPLSPEAVRRLRRMTEVADTPGCPSDHDDQGTTHADDLLRRLLQS